MAHDSNESMLDFAAIIQATNLHQQTNYSHLKKKQEEALIACYLGDSICVLPTGFGKTVVIQMLPFLIPDHLSTVVIATPLNAIMEEQKERFGEACVVVDDQLLQELEDEVPGGPAERFKAGRFQFLLGHPEKLTVPKIRRILMTPQISSKISHIVVDEAHCILSWGRSEFRPAFLDLCHLRASLPSAKMVALTATATSTAIAEISTALHMQAPKVVKASPDRPSVYIEVRRRPPCTGGDHTVSDSYDACIDPILSELAESEASLPRTIVYQPLKWCGYGHERSLMYLQDSSSFQLNVAEGDDQVKSFMAQYHAPQTSHMKRLISKSMLQSNGQLRLLFATEAYGMGADSPNVRRVVHIGPPSNLETYIQEIGRGGRDGLPAEAILYYNNSDLGPNKTHVTDSMRDFCRLTTCRREFLMRYFGWDLDRTDNSRCCDICSGTTQVEPPVEKPAKPIPFISLTLQDYFEAENEGVTDNCMPGLSTGLCKELADLISADPAKYMEDGALAEKFSFLLPSYIANIETILAALISQV